MTVDFLSMLEQEVERVQAEIPDDNVLANIASLAERQLHLEDTKKRLAELAQKVEDTHKDISERQLPNALASAGVTEFKLTDGSVVSVKKNYFPSVAPENQQEAYAWMVEAGHDIIKNKVELKFTKGESTLADEVVQRLEDLGYKPERKEEIHWQTFRAWAKEVMEKGVAIPETIKIHIVDKTTVKRK